MDSSSPSNSYEDPIEGSSREMSKISSPSAKRKRVEEVVDEESPAKRALETNIEETAGVKNPPVTEKNDDDNDDSPAVAVFETEEEARRPMPKEFSLEEEVDEMEEEDVDVVGEPEMVLPPATSSGEILRKTTEQTPTKDNLTTEEFEYDGTPIESVFSTFPCQLVPETITRMTKTPIEGENLEVRKNSNGRLRIFVTDHCRKYTPYSTMTHRPCIVCNRVMRDGEMHLNFPADLDRRRIWANLLGFKYKDILRSKVGPISCSIAGGPICTEHFAEECFRNHNFNKAAIEAFGVPVAISPDVKTTPSKKRVPWVCTICDFNTCSVVDLQRHLLEHTEQMLRFKTSNSEIPSAGFMCPFCRKCTYGYRTVNGFRRHLLSPPVHHCHLRRIYDFAKMNCRSSELEPMESWDKWTRRNVYVAYHGCEPPIDEIILTPSPTKSTISLEERAKKMAADAEKRKKAVRSLSFVGKEGGTSVNESNVMQRAVMLQAKRLEESTSRSSTPEVLIPESPPKQSAKPKVAKVGAGKKKDVERDEPEQRSVKSEFVVPLDTVKEEQIPTETVSAVNSPVKNLARSHAKMTTQSCPSSPMAKKSKRKEPIGKFIELETLAEVAAKEERKLVDDSAFQQMIEKRAKAVQRLIRSKRPNQQMRPRKAFTAYTVSKATPNASESQGDNKVGESSAPSTSEAVAPVEKEAVEETKPEVKVKEKKHKEKEVEPEKEEEERPLKSALLRSFVAGQRSSMAKYQVPITASYSYGAETKLESKPFVPGFSTKSASFPAPYKQQAARRPPSNIVLARSGVLGRRPTILSQRAKLLRKNEEEFDGEKSEPDQVTRENEEIMVERVEEVSTTVLPPTKEKPMITLAEALAKTMEEDATPREEMEQIAKEMLKDTYLRSVEDVIRTRKASKLKREMKMSKHCMRQLEAASARARLFGEGEDDRFDIVETDDGPQLIARRDPEWKLRNQEHGFDSVEQQ